MAEDHSHEPYAPPLAELIALLTDPASGYPHAVPREMLDEEALRQWSDWLTAPVDADVSVERKVLLGLRGNAMAIDALGYVTRGGSTSTPAQLAAMVQEPAFLRTLTEAVFAFVYLQKSHVVSDEPLLREFTAWVFSLAEDAVREREARLFSQALKHHFDFS